ncbi:MAG: LCP family protein [Oscillospiraceae bacterium]|nr:LCP family protein [Oscillospiraceae bacterium]
MAKYKGKFENGVDRQYDAPQPSLAEQEEEREERGGNIALKIILITLLILLIMAAAVLAFATHYLNKINREEIKGDMTLTHTDLLEPEEITDEEDTTEIIEKVWQDFEAVKEMPMIETDENVVNYLLIGCDSRDSGMAGRSDAMMVVSLNKETKKIHITSLMRACFVVFPEGLQYPDGMLNWAFSWGGPETLIETIEMNFKIDIDHYVAVNFEAFKDVVDAMGGVEVQLTGGEAGYINTEVVSGLVGSGLQTLNGDQALAFARCRHAYEGDNDFRRTSRQRLLIEAMIRKVGSLGLTELTNLADTLLPAVSTDLSNAEIMAELVNVPEYASYEIDQMLVPVENQAGTSFIGVMRKYGVEMYAIDWSTNLPALEAFIKN